MTIYDASMVGIVIAGMVWGALRGITWQVAGIASLVLGYAMAVPLSGELAGRFPGEPVVARGLAMLTIYVAVSLGVYFVAWLIRATLRRLKFEAYDRHLGMLLGGAEGALLGIVATVFVVSLAPDAREPILTSPSGRVVNRLLDVVQPALPGELRKVLTPFWDDPNGAPAEHRLADLDEPGARRLDEIPDDASAALDWLQRRLPGSAEPGVAPTTDRTVDPALVRSALELGAQQLRDRTRTSDADRAGPPTDRSAARQTYWWEEDAHGRDAGHR